jgi:hypothetical protein
MEGWKGGRMEGWKVGRVEGWKVGRVEGWKDGRMEGWEDGRMEGWEDGRLEGWKVGRWKDGRVEALMFGSKLRRPKDEIRRRLEVLRLADRPGGGHDTPTVFPEEDYNLVMSTNVASFFFMTQQVIPQMKKQNSGHVVNISAVLADQPSGAVPALLAVLSKSPMPAVSKALALEYAANNIRFNTVSPGNINTPMHARIIMRRWRNFIPSLGWVKFLTSSTRCSIFRTPRS